MGHPVNVEEQKLALLDAGGCWIDDPETEGSCLLHPDFSTSWTDNSVWHDLMVTFAQTHLTSVSPSLSDQDIEQLADATIKNQLQTVFKGITSKYRKWAKSQGKALAPIAHSDLPNVKNRRARRKERVSAMLSKSIPQLTSKLSRNWKSEPTKTGTSSSMSCTNQLTSPMTVKFSTLTLIPTTRLMSPLPRSRGFRAPLRIAVKE
jgi:hypothetical protein